MGLYLKQVVNYINQCLAPLGNIKITSSMVSNYVKHDLIASPEGRLYSREQIATLLFITIAKNVMDQEDLRKAIAIQQKKELQKIGHDNTSQKQMLRNVIMAFAYREYLYQFFKEI
ncbi:DUF1836 domain-containing protein [Lactobacillus amylovorus subsp. amylovorus]|uniref:DUF1836 domain-containing protein n=1 Tax=Lactobacillus amylovorus TaxID=1604 RepID=UPI002850C739|nr:DUF1836 domain-containing protein [Lactobacillus amylovorus]